MSTDSQTCIPAGTGAVDLRDVAEFLIDDRANIVATGLALAETVTIYTVNLDGTKTTFNTLTSGSPVKFVDGPIKITFNKTATAGACAVEMWSK